MKQFLLGILFTYAIHYILNPYYEFNFHQYFSNECGVQNGYSGTSQERFDCVYKEMGLLKPVASFILARPRFIQTNEGYELKVVY